MRNLIWSAHFAFLIAVRSAYVTHEDICRCFKGDTLLAIQAPSGTQLEVPIPEVVSASHSGPLRHSTGSSYPRSGKC